MNRPPRILWATRNCLVDHTSGASLSAREMLYQLAARGCEVEIVGATIFEGGDGPPELRAQLDTVDKPGTLLNLPDGPLKHILVKTASPRMQDMRIYELDKLFSLYRNRLETWQPDLVWVYGGRTFELLALADAKQAGAATAFFLVNGNYHGHRWHRDVDVILTDSEATAEFYRSGSGLDAQPVGKFIRRETVVADHHERRHVTFINPKPEKGAYLVAQMALALETRRPDIVFEVVESRGVWADVVRRVTEALGTPREALSNVVVTPTTTDMRPVYGRSRVVLLPSLWWESGPRVIAEAMLNGIPAVVTNRGGPPEMIGKGGVTLTLPDAFHEAPYTRLLPPDALAAVLQVIERIQDDKTAYRSMVEEARKTGRALYDIAANTDRLVAVLGQYLPMLRADGAGDGVPLPR